MSTPVSDKNCLIYGANGFSGQLIAREALAKGLRPILAGRNAAAMARVGRELGLPTRVFPVSENDNIDENLKDVDVLLNCAGPFRTTYKPLIESCLRLGIDYLDITGTIDIYEKLNARNKEYVSAGITVCPGVAFDTIPGDCLAVRLHQSLPDANRLHLGFEVEGRTSTGTTVTIIDELKFGSFVREGGVLNSVPLGHNVRKIDFGRGLRNAYTIPWGDLATAYYSTKIPNMEFYTVADPGMFFIRAIQSAFTWRWFESLIKWSVKKFVAEPSQNELVNSKCYFWGEASNEKGQKVQGRLAFCNSYTFTARSAVYALNRVLNEEFPAGYFTPTQLFGERFIENIEGVDPIILI